MRGFDNRIIARSVRLEILPSLVSDPVDVAGDLQINGFTVYELACTLQYV